MMKQVQLGHDYHVAGSPLITEAAEALVSIADGALVVDDGKIRYCGEHSSLPREFESHPVHHTGGFLSSVAEVYVQGRKLDPV